MHRLASFNHQIVSLSATKISAFSQASFYGKSIFTTLAVYNSKPFLWKNHWLRINESAERMGISLSDFTEEPVISSLSAIIQENSLRKGRARLTFFEEKPSQIWSLAAPERTKLLITTADFSEKKEIRLTVSSSFLNSTSPLVNIKSGNYLENILVLEEARKRGFDEAVRVNERGEVVSSSLANIFWLKNGELFTPESSTGCLSGTTRAFLLENFPVSEVTAGLPELLCADDIFLSSAGMGVAKVKSLEDVNFSWTDEFLHIDRFFNKLITDW